MRDIGDSVERRSGGAEEAEVREELSDRPGEEPTEKKAMKFYAITQQNLATDEVSGPAKIVSHGVEFRNELGEKEWYGVELRRDQTLEQTADRLQKLVDIIRNRKRGVVRESGPTGPTDSPGVIAPDTFKFGQQVTDMFSGNRWYVWEVRREGETELVMTHSQNGSVGVWKASQLKAVE